MNLTENQRIISAEFTISAGGLGIISRQAVHIADMGFISAS
jgi:hypothetical protein